MNPADANCGGGNACPWYGCSDLGGEDACVINSFDQHCGGTDPDFGRPVEPPEKKDDGCSGFFGCIKAGWDATGGKAVSYIDDRAADFGGWWDDHGSQVLAGAALFAGVACIGATGGACAIVVPTLMVAQAAESARGHGVAPGGAPMDWNGFAQDMVIEAAAFGIGKGPGVAADNPGVGYDIWDLIVGTAYDIPDWKLR